MESFNNRLTFCAGVVGIDISIIHFLRMYDSARKGDDVKFGQAYRRGASDDISLYTLMGNSSVAGKEKELIENHVSKNVGRDQQDIVNSAGSTTNRGRMLVQIAIDEADLFATGTKG